MNSVVLSLSVIFFYEARFNIFFRTARFLLTTTYVLASADIVLHIGRFSRPAPTEHGFRLRRDRCCFVRRQNRIDGRQYRKVIRVAAIICDHNCYFVLHFEFSLFVWLNQNYNVHRWYMYIDSWYTIHLVTYMHVYKR